MDERSDDRWVTHMRAFLARREASRLDKVVHLLAPYPELLSIVESFRTWNLDVLDDIDAWLDRQADAVDPEVRETLRLMHADVRAALVELYGRLPPDQQEHALQIGIEACEEALALSDEVEDVACAAFYAGKLGNGAAHVRQFERAEAAYRHALQRYQDLYRTHPPRYADHLASTWNNVGNLLKTLDRYEEAEAAYRETIALLQQHRGDHGQLAMAWNNLGMVLNHLARYEEAEIHYRRALDICERQAQADRSLQAMVWTNLGTLLTSQRRYGAAESALQTALGLYQELCDTQPRVYTSEVAMVWNNLGVVRRYQRRYEEAEVAHREAVGLYGALQAMQPSVYSVRLARAKDNLGTTLVELRRYEEAEEAFREALSIREQGYQEQPDVYRSDLADSWSSLGNVLYLQTRYTEAEAAQRESLSLRQGLYEEQPHVYAKVLASSWSELGNTLRKQHRTEEAETAYRKALTLRQQLYEAQPDVYASDLASAWSNVSVALSEQMHYEEAERASRKALSLREELYSEQPQVYASDLAMAWNNLGVVLGHQVRYEEAETAHREALALRQRLYRRQPDLYTDDLAGTWSNIGNVLRSQKRYGEAEAAYRKALAYRKLLHREQPEVYARSLAGVWSNLGEVLKRQGQYSEAEKAHREALELRQHLYEHHPQIHARDIAASWTSLGHVLGLQERYQEAERAFRTAITLDPDGFLEPIHFARWGLGAVFLIQQRRAACLELWTYAMELIEERRGLLHRTEDRQVVHSQNVPHYEGLVEIALALHRPQEAWHWAERGKARTLLDQLGSARPGLRTEEQKTLFRQWEQAEREAARSLYTLQQAEQAAPSSSLSEEDERLKDWKANQAKAIDLRKRLAFSLGTAGDLVAVQVPEPEVLAQRLARLAMDTHTLLVQFVLLDMDHFALFLLPLWQVTDDEPLPLFAEQYSVDPEQLEALLHQFQRALDALSDGDVGTSEDLMAPLPRMLGECFIQPWQHHLERLQPDALLVVPSGSLHRLPLHAGLLSDDRPLIGSYPVLYLGSVSMAQYLVDGQRLRSTERLVLGPPHPPEHARYQAGADRETQRLAEIWGTQRYAFDAMTTDVLRQRASQIDIAHLATHSVFDADDYLQSYLQFHQEHVTLFELISDARLDFSGMRLCYLSSCEAGRSRIDGAEDLQGLVWALMNAGAEAVMASLWPVEDGVSEWMAAAFYRRLREGWTSAEAYQEAMMAVREQTDFANPVYWAPFVLFGNGFISVDSIQMD